MIKTNQEDTKESIYVKNICQEIIKTNNHISVVATAGSGKTTLLLKALELMPRYKKVILLSFSNFIVEELRKRAPSHVRVSTLHSLGLQYLRAYYPDVTINENKYFQKALNNFTTRNKETYKACYIIKDICQFIRLTLTPLKFKEVEQMCLHYDLNYTDKLIQDSINLIKNEGVPYQIDFADMIYLPATNDFTIQEQYHVVLLDEAQDSSNAQIEFAKKILHPNGRLISVGDPNQAIYGFAGADLYSFKKLANLPNTISMPLSISYRCPKRVVEQAKKIYDVIEAAPNAIDGEVRNGFCHEIREGDMVLARNNLPLLELYFYLIEHEIKANIVGKDVEKDIINVVETYMANTKDKIEEKLYEKLLSIENGLRAKGMTKPENHQKYISFNNKIELILTILRKVNTVKELIPKIHEIFTEDTEGAKLMTGFKAKGSQADVVFYMQKFKNKQLIPSQYATTKWQKLQEKNLDFVMTTRAKKKLIYFDFDGI